MAALCVSRGWPGRVRDGAAVPAGRAGPGWAGAALQASLDGGCCFLLNLSSLRFPRSCSNLALLVRRLETIKSCFLLRVVEVAKPIAGESGQQTAGTHFSPLFCSFPPSAAWRMGCCANNCPCRERILCWWLQSLSQTQRSSVLPLNPESPELGSGTCNSC